MRSQRARRVAALALKNPATRELTESEVSWLHYLSAPSLPVVLETFAERKAERRFLAERGLSAGRPLSNGRGWYVTRGDGWFWHTDETERAARVRRELADLEGLLSLYALHEAVRLWLAEGDDPAWPPLDRVRIDTYDQFVRSLAGERDRMAVHRNGPGDLAAAWRRAHPEWHPDMTAEEHDEWEGAR